VLADIADILGRNEISISSVRQDETADVDDLSGVARLVIMTHRTTEGRLRSNLAFGAAHAATQLYFILAAFLGLYLTALIAVDPTPNLLIPITAHTVYDIAAFTVVLHDYRKHDR
jgi:hypothetical protein